MQVDSIEEKKGTKRKTSVKRKREHKRGDLLSRWCGEEAAEKRAESWVSDEGRKKKKTGTGH